MFKLEKKLLEWVETHIIVLAVVFLTVISAVIRFSLRQEVSCDAAFFLLPWYDEIWCNGGVYALSQQVGNYNIPYQFLIAIATYLPISPLSAYKAISCLFDYVLAGGVGYLVYFLSETDGKRKGLLAYFIVIFSPIVFLNSAGWAQCDSIYASFCILTLVALSKKKHVLAFVFYGCAFAFKLQAVFLLPFMLFYYFYQRRFSILYFAIIPVMMIVLSIPGIVMGRSIGDVFDIYSNQTDEYHAMTYKYPNIWSILVENEVDQFSAGLRPAAIGMTVAALAILMVLIVVLKVKMDAANYIYIAFLLTYTTVYFLPSMHDRYGYLFEILSIVLIFFVPKIWKLALVLHFPTLCMYSNFLYAYDTADYRIYGVINTVVYIAYIITFFKRNGKENVLESK